MSHPPEATGLRANWHPYLELLSYIKPYKGRFIFGVSMGVLFALVNGSIPLLVKFFAHRLSKRHGKGITKVPNNTMKALENYSWPGNVRELINVIERAVIVSDGPELRLVEKIDVLPIGSGPEKVTEDTEEGETKGLAEVEREHILSTLQEAGWKIEGNQGAAKLLGMNPSTMRARMRKLGIDARRFRASR